MQSVSVDFSMLKSIETRSTPEYQMTTTAGHILRKYGHGRLTGFSKAGYKLR